MSGIEAEGIAAEYERQEAVSGAPNNFHSNALAASISVKPGPGALFGFTVLNTNAVAQYIQVFDAQTLPADGTTPATVFRVSGSSDKAVEWVTPRAMLYGIVLCNSSTAATKTIGAADCFFDVQYL